MAYASTSLSRAEQHYCVTRKELLAIMKFTHHFRPYLLGKWFTLRTDHGSLTWLAHLREPTGQLARWLEQLQEFDFDIYHRPGRKHQNADELSQIPYKQCGRPSHNSEPPLDTAIGALTVKSKTTLKERTSTEIQDLQMHDQSIGFIMVAKEKDQRPTSVNVKGKGREAKRLYQLWDRLEIRDETLHWLY